MSELVREPTDAEFAALMDGVSPDRQREPGLPPADNEPAPEPAVEAVPEVATETLPEKYQGKTPAELAQMHAQLEQRLGQQGQELGELRRISEEFEQLRTQLTPAETPPWEAPQSGFDSLDEQVLTNPKETLDWIVQNQPQLKDRALSTWAQLDPFAASRYDTESKIADLQRQHAEELAAVRAPVVQSQNDALLQTAYQNVANTNPALAQVAEDIPALLEENPEFKVLLGNGDVPTRERALNNLVAIAASRRGASGTPVNAAQAAHQAKVLATVATTGSAADHAGGQTGSDAGSRMLASEGTSVADELARSRAAYAAGQKP